MGQVSPVVPASRSRKIFISSKVAWRQCNVGCSRHASLQPQRHTSSNIPSPQGHASPSFSSASRTMRSASVIFPPQNKWTQAYNSGN